MEATKSNLRFAFIYNSKRDVVVFALSLPELENYIHLLYQAVSYTHLTLPTTPYV